MRVVFLSLTLDPVNAYEQSGMHLTEGTSYLIILLFTESFDSESYFRDLFSTLIFMLLAYLRGISNGVLVLGMLLLLLLLLLGLLLVLLGMLGMLLGLFLLVLVLVLLVLGSSTTPPFDFDLYLFNLSSFQQQWVIRYGYAYYFIAYFFYSLYLLLLLDRSRQFRA